VDVLAVDLGGELGVPVELGLPRSPVVAGLPVVDQALDIIERDAVVGAHAGQLVGPAHPGQPVGEVVQLGLGDLDAERTDGGVGVVRHGFEARSPIGRLRS
jgi:hypothetical protein